MPVIYDTGSFEIVILSDLCTDCETRAPLYSQHQSDTFDQGENIVETHVYGSGPVTSRKGLETVIVGDHSSPLVATHMPFFQVMSHEIDVWHKWSEFSGIVGLGHSPHVPNSDREDEEDDIYGDDASLLTAVGVTAFSMCLERSPGTPPGWLSMGPETEAQTQDPSYQHIPVFGKFHWAVVMSSLEAGGRESYNACNPSCAAIVDSGTSLIAAPREAFEALAPVFNAIDPGCGNLDTLPDLTFRLGEETFSIPPSIYVIEVEDIRQADQTIWDAWMGPPELIKEKKCIPAFLEMNMMEAQYGPVWILGMPFLRYYYTVFQREPKSIHVKYATADCQPSSTIPPMYNGFHNKTTAGVFVNSSAHVRSAKHTVGVDRHGEVVRRVKSSDIQVPQWARGGLRKRNGTSVSHPVVKIAL